MPITEVKFLTRLPGGMLEYETTRIVDAEVEHDSYPSLRQSLHRPGRTIGFIHYGATEITDEESYYSCIISDTPPHRRLLVLYRIDGVEFPPPPPPLHYYYYSDYYYFKRSGG